MLDDDTDHRPIAERHAHPRSDRWNGHTGWDAVSEGIEKRDRYRDGNHEAFRIARTLFMSSHTSRFDEGLRRRYAG